MRFPLAGVEVPSLTPIPGMPDCLSPSSLLKLCLPSGTGSNSRFSCSCSLNTSLELFLTTAPAENKQCSAICGRSHRSDGRRISYGAGRGQSAQACCQVAEAATFVQEAGRASQQKVSQLAMLGERGKHSS